MHHYVISSLNEHHSVLNTNLKNIADYTPRLYDIAYCSIGGEK